jgi:hypothetical protein
LVLSRRPFSSLVVILHPSIRYIYLVHIPYRAIMMVPARLIWLAHVLPAAALTVTSPQTTPAAIASTSTSTTSCGSGNLVVNGDFVDSDIESGSTWEIPSGGAVVDGYL